MFPLWIKLTSWSSVPSKVEPLSPFPTWFFVSSTLLTAPPRPFLSLLLLSTHSSSVSSNAVVSFTLLNYSKCLQFPSPISTQHKCFLNFIFILWRTSMGSRTGLPWFRSLLCHFLVKKPWAINFVPQFPHLWNRDINSTHLIRLFWGMCELIHKLYPGTKKAVQDVSNHC